MALKVTKKSPFTGKVTTLILPIDMEQVNRWQKGELIQNVMPELSADEREFLISGAAPGEWDEMWKRTDEEEKADGE